jgi:hypothetical protein
VSGRGVEAAVADIVPDTREIFLFDEAVIVFLAGSGPGEGDAVGITSGQEGMVDELRAVIAVSMPRRGKGRAWMTHFWALLRRGRSSTQPEATSVASRVRGERSFPQGYQKKAQTARRQAITSGP